MAYTKTTWETGDIITADKLNNMEDGIDKATIKIVPTKAGVSPITLDKTWQEIKDLFDAGYLMCIAGLPSFIMGVGIEEETYYIAQYSPHLVNGHMENAVMFVSNSADDYPVLEGGAG